MQQDLTVAAFCAGLELAAGVRCSQEQRDFYQHFDRPTFCFACPGTGKTTVSALGLLKAELYDGIPGQNIYAVSFSRESAAELMVRHRRFCTQMHIKQTINTSTLHSLCAQIIREHYDVLDMDTVQIGDGASDELLINMLEKKCMRRNINTAPNTIKNILYAIRTLNSSLSFSRDAVETKVCFKRCGISYDEFMQLRYDLYIYDKLAETVPVDSILLYTLEILMREPKVVEEYQEKCKLLLVDEAQDMSLLQLRIVTLLSKNVIVIGDVKQRIYSFNGACQEVVEQFKKYFPNAKECTLSMSYRCCNEIADYATTLIAPNKMDNSKFVGKGNGGKVTILQNMNIKQIVSEIAVEYRQNNNTFPRDIMFLFRNNSSCTPIVEELYKQQLPIRVKDYTPAYMLPYIKQLCDVVELAIHANEPDKVIALQYVMPEMEKYTSPSKNPLYKIAKSTGKSLLDINYAFQDVYLGKRVIDMLREVRDMVSNYAVTRDVFNKIWPYFSRVYVEKQKKFDTLGSEYYIRLVNSIVSTKTYQEFMREESDKVRIIKRCLDIMRGVRCYTFHGSKGLEADVVNIVDAEEGIIPSQRALRTASRLHCDYEAAVSIRDERSLVYVAVTRAKKEVNIYYNDELSSLFTTRNDYKMYDNYFQGYKQNYLDVEIFEDFFRERLGYA